MNYILVDDCGTDEFVKEFESQEEAIKAGEDEYYHISLDKTDLKRRKAFYLLKSVNPDPEAENHFDGEVIKKWL